MNLDTMSEPMLYDLFNADCTEDIEMYKVICSDADQILELGIGTGRLAIPLAQFGVRVVGIDNSEKMLSTLEEKIALSKVKGITYYRQDMRSLSLDSEFDLILCPFCTFNFLLSLDDQEKALLSIKKHMKTGGRIVFDLLTPNTFSGSFLDGSLKHFNSYQCPEHNKTIEIYTSSKLNQCNQLFSQNRIFRQYSDGLLTAERHTTMHNRLFFWGEFQLLLEKCGYRPLDIYGSYKFSPFTQSSQELIVVATLI